MKLIKFGFLACLVVLFTTACQKEISFESDGPSSGTLTDLATGICLPSTVHGIYKTDTALTVDHYIDVQVNFIIPGTYLIYTDTVNGFSFKNQGVVGTGGLQVIRLAGTGTPIATGTNQFTIHYDSSSCLIDVMVIDGNTPPATYTLSGAPDSCTNFVLSGIYQVGVPVTTAEFVTLTVDVITAGTYTMSATSAGGVNFSGSGVFTTTGAQNVTLNATGTPTAVGIFETTVQGTSSCPFSYTVTDPGTPPTNAVYSFDVAGTDCSGATVNGTFETNTALGASHNVVLNVNVTTPGNYTISTNSQNGITFTGTGNFAATGTQQVVLIGSGTPTTAGTFNFTVNGSGSSCTFSIVVIDTGTPPPTSNEEYLPMTTGSNFTLALVGSTADDTSHVRVIPTPIVLGTNTYQIFEYTYEQTPEDSAFYRKSNGKYYQYFENSYGLDNPFNKDGMILDSNLNVNDTWTVDLGMNSVGGTPLAMKIIGKIVEKNASATIAGNSYTKVIKVQLKYVYTIAGADTEALQHELWFAKGKGIIYQKLNDIPVTTTQEINTTRIEIF